MTTEVSEILGRPITGDIPRSTTGWGKQADPKDLIAAIDRVLAFEDVEGVQWEQYTPGWNDGEPCVFDANEVRVKFKGIDDLGDYDNGWMSAFDVRYNADGGYDRSYSKPVLINGIDRTPVVHALSELADELNEKHYVFLQETFGDPSQVTATREGFDVEYYECGY